MKAAIVFLLLSLACGCNSGLISCIAVNNIVQKGLFKSDSVFQEELSKYTSDVHAINGVLKMRASVFELSLLHKLALVDLAADILKLC
ncbi:Hypothetical predicted protein [Podarcis lilfordi]|nr:Hypothetical predicted protein [Podarcis lilfordi]